MIATGGRARWWPGLLLGAVLLTPGAVWGQQREPGSAVQGTVHDAATRLPIGGALVEIQDTLGRVVEHRLTNTSGTFRFPSLPAGRYQYRIVAIGYAPRPVVPLVVDAAGVRLPDLALSTWGVRLPDIIARGTRQYCGTDELGDAVFSQLLASARSSLEIVEATVQSGAIAFEVEQVRSEVRYHAVAGLERADTAYIPLAAWPIRSIPPDSLRVHGFMREYWDSEGEVHRHFYGPDARVLFAPWFLASHCFSLARISPASGRILVHFKPTRKSPQVDIKGTLTFHAGSLALESVEFTHENLPAWMTQRSAGGEMLFRQLPNGLWVAALWSLWGPIEGVSHQYRSQMSGIAEIRGRVVRIIQTPRVDELVAQATARPIQ